MRKAGRVIDGILDDMIGANYMITQQQIMDIRAQHDEEISAVNTIIEAVARDAYEYGRAFDRGKMTERIGFWKAVFENVLSGRVDTENKGGGHGDIMR